MYTVCTTLRSAVCRSLALSVYICMGGAGSRRGIFSPCPGFFFPDLFCFPSPTSILPLPFHAACYLQHFGAGTFHFACSLQHLGAGTFHAACYLQHFGAGTFYFACYLPHLGAGTFHLSCYLPHLRAGTFQFACYL